MKYIVFENESFKIKEWKQTNDEYIIGLQKFLDVASNVEDKRLRNTIISQMLKCDEILSNLSESLFEKCYKEGYEEAMNKKIK